MNVTKFGAKVMQLIHLTTTFGYSGKYYTIQTKIVQKMIKVNFLSVFYHWFHLLKYWSYDGYVKIFLEVRKLRRF